MDRIQRRMHNKIFVADNAVAITGGRNLGETYFGQGESTNFVDAEHRAGGPGGSRAEAARSFDLYWNNPLAYPVESLMTAEQLEAMKPPRQRLAHCRAGTGHTGQRRNQCYRRRHPTGGAPAKPAKSAVRKVTALDGSVSVAEPLPDSTNLALLEWIWAPSTLLVDKASKIAADADEVEASQDTTVDGLLQLMAEAKSDLLIVSPYFVPGQRMMSQLAAIRQKNVRIQVYWPSSAGVQRRTRRPCGYARYRKELLGLGIELYEMHASRKAP